MNSGIKVVSLLLHVRNAHAAIKYSHTRGLATARRSDNASVGERQSLGACIPLVLPQSDSARDLILNQDIATAVASPVSQVDECSRGTNIERERVVRVPERRVVSVRKNLVRVAIGIDPDIVIRASTSHITVKSAE